MWRHRSCMRLQREARIARRRQGHRIRAERVLVRLREASSHQPISPQAAACCAVGSSVRLPRTRHPSAALPNNCIGGLWYVRVHPRLTCGRGSGQQQGCQQQRVCAHGGGGGAPAGGGGGWAAGGRGGGRTSPAAGAQCSRKQHRCHNQAACSGLSAVLGMRVSAERATTAGGAGGSCGRLVGDIHPDLGPNAANGPPRRAWHGGCKSHLNWCGLWLAGQVLG